MESLPARLTVNDIARAAGVSRGTVSNVFSHPERVRAELRARVLSVAQDLGYAGPDPRGRLLREGTFKALGYVVPGAYGLVNVLESPYGRELLLGISEACDDAGFALTMIDGRPEQADSAINNALVDGIIIGNDGNMPFVERAIRRGLRIVIIDLGVGPDIDSVGFDAFAGASVAAQHLLQLGHRRFAIVSVRRTQGPPILHPPGSTRELDDGSPLDREKLRGYSSALQKAGIDVAGIPIIEAVPWETGIGAAILSQAPDATGLLVMADRQATGILEDFQNRGIDVPGHVSIIGFDGVPASASTVPPLTTIAQQTREKGRLAARLLLERRAPRQLTLPTQLVVRASTAPPRQ